MTAEEMTAEEMNGSQEFMYLPLGKIMVEEQIRTGIDTESESFKALMESIKDRGVLEPLLVTPKDGNYLLLCGERRFLASQKLGMVTIPVRVMDAVTQKDEILAYQLTENMQREDLNPIDQAKGILAYVQTKHPDKGYNLEGLMSELVNYSRTPDYVPDAVSLTVRETVKISGKSIQTLHRSLSLLKLSDEIQAALREGKLPVSQGYLFAANLDNPDLVKIFQEVMKKPVTNAKLESRLTEYKKVKRDLSGMKPKPLTKQNTSLRSIKTVITKGAGKYAKADLEKL
ncbi:MAG: ParB/RepB/Spo0J family partition protein, partial [Deltaproteobacteria bacterium]